MANLKEVWAKTTEMKWKIDSLLRLSTYNDYGPDFYENLLLTKRAIPFIIKTKEMGSSTE